MGEAGGFSQWPFPSCVSRTNFDFVMEEVDASATTGWPKLNAPDWLRPRTEALIAELGEAHPDVQLFVSILQAGIIDETMVDVLFGLSRRPRRTMPRRLQSTFPVIAVLPWPCLPVPSKLWARQLPP